MKCLERLLDRAEKVAPARGRGLKSTHMNTDCMRILSPPRGGVD